MFESKQTFQVFLEHFNKFMESFGTVESFREHRFKFPEHFSVRENIQSCLAACPDCSVFHSVPKLLVCLEIF